MRQKVLLLIAGVVFIAQSGSAAPPGPPSWPSLTEQLRGVEPGSAVDKLIRDNQEIWMLQPGEAGDGFAAPPWLRVWWRKHHPEIDFPPDQPLAGYPRVLLEIHEWMMLHQDLRPDPPKAVGRRTAHLDGGPDPVDAWYDGGVEALAGSPPAWGPTVGANLNVSGAQSTPRSESDIMIDWRRPQNVVAASNNIGGSRQAMYRSSNGGASWSRTTLPLVLGDDLHSDPTVDWNSDGSAWTTTLGIDNGTGAVRVRVYTSTDGGATWTYDSTASGTQTGTDKQMARVSNVRNGSYLVRRLHTIWHTGTPVYVNYKTLPTYSWSTPLLLSGAETSGVTIGADITVNTDGHVFAFWPSSGNRRILMRRSTTSGASYETVRTVATTFAAYEFPIPAFAIRRPFVYVSAGTYKGTAYHNHVYASWTDLSGETGCTSNANAPGTNTSSSCKSRIWFSRSTDGGTTWSAPVKINNQPGKNDQFNQRLMVDQKNGMVSIVYYDTVNDPGRKKADLWIQSSYDDGLTWTPAVRVSSASTDETVSGANLANQYGDYNGLAAFSGALLPSWTDRRNGGNEQIWTAPVQDVCEPCGNPFSFLTAGDQAASCYAQATGNATNCNGVADVDDRFLCNAMAIRSDTPCGSINDRDLYWSCKGMSVDAGFGTCINVSDADMSAFCYDVSRNTTQFGYCDYHTNSDTKNLCYAMAGKGSSFCANISHVNTRNFCYGVTTGNTSYCAAIQ